MKIFKKGIEYNNLAKAFNGVNLMIEGLLIKDLDADELMQELYVLAYISRKGIIDKIEKYKWNISNTIVVPSISKRRISIAEALKSTVSRITAISEDIGIYQEIKEVLDRGEFFYEMERNIPEYIKNIAFS